MRVILILLLVYFLFIGKLLLLLLEVVSLLDSSSGLYFGIDISVWRNDTELERELSFDPWLVTSRSDDCVVTFSLEEFNREELIREELNLFLPTL